MALKGAAVPETLFDMCMMQDYCMLVDLIIAAGSGGRYTTTMELGEASNKRFVVFAASY